MYVRRFLAALMLPALLVSCSTDKPSSDPPGPSSSATVSPSPTATPSGLAIPAEAQGTDAASAKAFVRFWFEVFSSAMNTGDPAFVMELSTKECVSCKAIRRNIRRTYVDGRSVRAEGWSPTSIRKLAAFESLTFALIVRQGEEEYLNAAGDVVRHFSGGRRRMKIQLIRRGSTWLVQGLDIER
jgi:hypothetical protein